MLQTRLEDLKQGRNDPCDSLAEGLRPRSTPACVRVWHQAVGGLMNLRTRVGGAAKVAVVSVVCLIAFAVPAHAAAIIDFSSLGLAGVTINVDAFGNVVGSNIGIDLLTVSGAPQNNGTYDVAKGVLSFDTGAKTISIVGSRSWDSERLVVEGLHLQFRFRYSAHGLCWGVQCHGAGLEESGASERAGSSGQYTVSVFRLFNRFRLDAFEQPADIQGRQRRHREHPSSGAIDPRAPGNGIVWSGWRRAPAAARNELTASSIQGSIQQAVYTTGADRLLSFYLVMMLSRSSPGTTSPAAPPWSDSRRSARRSHSSAAWPFASSARNALCVGP